VTRIRALLAKEFLDIVRNRSVLVPVVIVVLMSLVLPFIVVILVPELTGHALAEDAGLMRIATVAGVHEALTPEGQIQFFMLQQFLMLFLLTPITGAMALAAHSVVGEKQARTLEPLLATPISTIELLVAKVLGALLPTFLITMAGLALYVVGVAAIAAPGVARAMASPRSFLLMFFVAPAAGLVSLQAAIVISSRVNDPRTAQQFGVLIIIPLTALLVAQFTGTIWLTSSGLALVGVGLLGVWVLLTLFSAALFERESILTRWR
jgi:ABC-2 type transport system permease protein